jgi:hypothetical protein
MRRVIRGVIWCVKRVKDFWSVPVAPQPLAMMRIVFGVTLLAGVLLHIMPSLFLFWSRDGLIPPETAATYVKYNDRLSVFDLEPVARHVIPDDRLSVLEWADSDDALVCWFVLYCTALAMMTVGLFTRLACAAAWFMAMSFSMRGWWATNGGDDVGVLMLFYLMLSPCGAVWSLDALRRGAPAEERTIPAWPVRLIQIQLCLIYFFNGINKLELVGHESFQAFLDANDYISGKAVYYALNDNMLDRMPYEVSSVPFWVCCVLSWATITFELGFPLLVLFRRIRPLLIVGGILFHTGIFLSMEIGWFSLTMIAIYPILLSPEAAKAVGRWFARLVGRPPSWRVRDRVTQDVPGVPGINVPLR